MLNLNGPFLKPFLIALFISVAAMANAQNAAYDKITRRIDSLADIGLARSALKEIDKLDSVSRKNKDAPQQVIAVIYRINFMSYLEENALAAIISRLKEDIATAAFPVKPVLQSLLAEMYWKYYQQNRWQVAQRTALAKPDPDFTRWDLRTIINETDRLYQLSLKEAIQEQQVPVSVLDGALVGDTATRYLRPTLYDFLVHRAFDFYLADEPDLPKTKTSFYLNSPQYFADSRQFSQLSISSADTSATTFRGMRLLQQATAFHLAGGEAAAIADLDLKRLNFLFRKSVSPDKDSLYVRALQDIATRFAALPLSADALEMLGRHYQQKDSLRTAVAYLQKAIDAYPLSIGGRNARITLAVIQKQEVSVQLDEGNIPARPILALLSYRNVITAEAVYYKLSVQQFTVFSKLYQQGRSGQVPATDFLKAYKPMRSTMLNLPDPADYKKHSTEIAIEPLSSGQYVLMLKVPGDTLGRVSQVCPFQVSSLAFIARANAMGGKELRVLSRSEGGPLKNISVFVEQSSSYKNDAAIAVQQGLTDATGKFLFSQSDRYQLNIKVAVPKDTLVSSEGIYGNRYAPERSEYQTMLFSDRALYRPGQTIYFKGLRMLNSGNRPVIVPEAGLDVQLYDSNGKQLSTIAVKTNDFGTFTGTFVLPQSMLNGEITLQCPQGYLSLRVEEYKRPSFQVSFDRLKDARSLNDSISLNGAVTSFAGYGLSDARVSYRITRTVARTYYDYGNWMTMMAEDTVHTGSDGRFSIKFKASEDLRFRDLIHSFSIIADVTDASGETRSASTSIRLGRKPLLMAAYLPARMLEKDTASIPLGIMNLSGTFRKGTVQVKVFSLKTPGAPLKQRLWQYPDQHLLPESRFREMFPEYAFGTEDRPQNMQKIAELASFSVDTDTGRIARFSREVLKGRPAGMYRFEFYGRDLEGDTVSAVQYTSWITAANKPVTLDAWEIPWTVPVAYGEEAEFLAGPGKRANILMEVYDGAKLISEEWLRTGAVQVKKALRIRDTWSKNLRVSFLMLLDNRLYFKNEQNIIRPANSKLNVSLASYRNLLQPGDKEKWTVRVAGADNGKNIAEMLVSMYDASLDKIFASGWPAPRFDEIYYGGYNMWNTNNFQLVASFPIFYDYSYTPLLSRDYEKLDMMGYNYYGTYNLNYRNYLNRIEQRKRMADAMEAAYRKNAALIKQGFELSGRLSDEKGRAVAGASVRIKGVSIAISTDADGKYKIRVPVNGVVVFSMAGFLAQEFGIAKNAVLNITMKPDPAVKGRPTRDDYRALTVNGIGLNIEARDQALSSVAVSAKELNELSASSAGQALQGRLSGINIRGTGSPGAAPFSEEALKKAGNSIPGTPADGTVNIRTNFNETPFFYPQLRTNEKGEVIFEFTAPDALTQWKFRAMAHTRDLKWGYLEAATVTQKQLMVSTNAPRFFREGDTITVSTRVANLTKDALMAQVELKLFNGLSMQPVTLFADPAQSRQELSLSAASNKAVSFKIIIPTGLDAITYRLTASSGTFSDGEENTVPVLPNSMLVTESMPMMVRAGQSRSFALDKLVHNTSSTLRSKSLTLEFTQNPTWYAVQALPYLMEFPYECSEQTFSRYYANSMAAYIVNSRPVIKRVFETWKTSNSTALLSNLEKNPELKALLIEETPWLRDAEKEGEQKRRIALLFDMNRMAAEAMSNLSKLDDMQMADGGFPWFAGSRYPDRYITQHIIAGIGQLQQLGIADIKTTRLADISARAIGFLDNALIESRRSEVANKLTDNDLHSITIHAWYARSYFNTAMSPALQPAFNDYLKKAAAQWKFRNVYEQGMIALTMARYKKTELMQIIVASLTETAQRSQELDMYWAKNQLGYYWYQSPVEAQAMLIELFTEAGGKGKDIEEMKIWLLRNKQANNWRTTKATAAACYALLLRGSDWLNDAAASDISLGGTPLASLKPDLKTEAGTGYIKTSWSGTEIAPQLGRADIRNNGKTINWGALHWQYTEKLDKISSSETNLKLERKYFIMKGNATLAEASAANPPKVGDLLKVVVYLKADRDFEYVHLKDMRPAGTEPGNILSGYKYQDGLFYYQVMKDASANFFISNLPKGNYVFEYSLRVAQPGSFSTGISSIQCMYAPEFNAHSEGRRMDILSP